MDYRTLRLSDARRAALDAVADMGQATCQEVADALGQDKSNVHKTLSALLRDGFLAKSGQTYHLIQDDDERNTTTTTSTTTTTATTSTTANQNAGGESGSGGSGRESTTTAEALAETRLAVEPLVLYWSVARCCGTPFKDSRPIIMDSAA
jgi:hypothetical protein